VIDVMDDAGSDPVYAHKRHPAEDSFDAEEFRQAVLISQAVLKREQNRVVLQERADERLHRFVSGGLERDEDEIGFGRLRRIAMNLQLLRRKREVAVKAADLQAVGANRVVVATEQQMDIGDVSANESSGVEPADGADADNEHHGTLIGQETQRVVLVLDWGGTVMYS